MSQWLIFTEERAGRPWLCPPAEGCATAPFFYERPVSEDTAPFCRTYILPKMV